MSKTEPTAQPLEIQDENALERLLLDARVPVVVCFGAPWCTPCRLQTPILEDCAREWNERALVAHVNVDRLPGLADRSGVAGIPTIVIHRDGRELRRLIGVQGKATLFDALERCEEESAGL